MGQQPRKDPFLAQKPKGEPVSLADNVPRPTLGGHANALRSSAPAVIESDLTVLDPEVAPRVKAEMLRVWDRVSKSKSLTQANLAKALDLTPSAVNKLLNRPDTHPWTILYIKVFCTFCGVDPIKEIVDRLRLPHLEGFFSDWDDEHADLDREFFEECASAIKLYYIEHGVNSTTDQVEKLAAKLVGRLDGGHAIDHKEMQREVERVILESAGK
jgi:hypothetical protein